MVSTVNHSLMISVSYILLRTTSWCTSEVEGHLSGGYGIPVSTSWFTLVLRAIESYFPDISDYSSNFIRFVKSLCYSKRGSSPDTLLKIKGNNVTRTSK